MNIVDALMISVGIDASGLVKGQKQAEDALKKTSEAATKTGKDIAAGTKVAAEGLGKVSSAALETFAIILGGKGLKEAIGDITRADVALGQLSTGLGDSSDLVAAWGIAARRMGGSASGAMGSLQALSDTLTDLRTQGKTPPIELFRLGADSGVDIDFLHGAEKLMLDLARASNALAKTDPAAANLFLRRIGADPATAALLIKQGPRMKQYLEDQKRLAPSKADTEAAQGLTNAWGKLGAEYDLVASKLTTALAPALEWIADKVGKAVEAVAAWIEKNPKLAAGITGMVAALAGIATVGAIGTVLGLTAALAGLAGISLTGLVGGLAALGLIDAAGLGTAAALGAFDEAKAGEGGRKPMGGNEVLRRRSRTERESGGTSANFGGNEAIARRGHHAANTTALVNAAQDELVKQGVPRENASAAAAALVGNVIQESGGDPNKVHDGGTGYGLYGARLARRDKLLADLRTHGYAANDAEQQMRHMVREALHDPTYRATAAALRGATVGNLGAVTNTVARDFKRPNEAAANYAGRRNNAALAYAAPRISPAGGAAVTAIDRALKPKDSLFTGTHSPYGALPPVGARPAAALNNVSNTTHATTSTSSNEMHIKTVNVNAPQATDAHGIAGGMHNALSKAMGADQANYGPR